MILCTITSGYDRWQSDALVRAASHNAQSLVCVVPFVLLLQLGEFVGKVVGPQVGVAFKTLRVLVP